MLQVYKSNALITASYKLSVQEARIILTCIAKITRDPNKVVTDEEMYCITAAEFAELCGISRKAAYIELKQAAGKLFERKIKFEMADRKRSTRWIQTADYLDGDGRVEVRFSKDVLPYLANLQSNYTKYNLKAILRLSSDHAQRLYEVIIKSRYTGRYSTLVDLSVLRFALNLGDSYPLYSDFRKRVIESSIKEINRASDILITGFTPKRDGRKISAIEFHYELKQDFGHDPVQEDLLQPQGSEPKAETKTTKRKPKHKVYSNAELEKNARPGESYEDVAMRLLREEEARELAESVDFLQHQTA
ncbi:MAG: RepB family plasmid replication initiator protein [Pseudomonas sp.]|nr:RepB family plasmid replication initiator protein [Pseudomonas sp.]|tara:strand:- start:2856 stop:3767 length:912 start_codon:yes stop_codon:yes gene_type:complete